MQHDHRAKFACWRKNKVKQQAKPVLVTQPYAPPVEQYMKYVKQILENRWFTNDGPLLKELTERLKAHFGVPYLLIVNNGTSALQLAYKIKGLTGHKAVTTPFSFPATATALEWQSSTPVLADIDKQSWNLCPRAVEQVVKDQDIKAIVPVNIFGAPCDMSAFDELGSKYDIPIIYDSAQALLSQYNGRSVLHYGDIHCISFHATKLFHCVEGGALIFNNKNDYERAKRLINFGIDDNGHVPEPGINAKMSELHAAMGLCVLDELPNLIEQRQQVVESYQRELDGAVEFQSTEYQAYTPPMYMAIKFNSENELLGVSDALNQAGYQARRYFYPKNHGFLAAESLELLNVNNQVSNKVLCLPLMHDLPQRHIKAISQIVKKGTK